MDSQAIVITTLIVGLIFAVIFVSRKEPQQQAPNTDETTTQCAQGYAPFDEYRFTQGGEGTGNLLTTANISPAGLKEMCDDMPACLGFSTDGKLFDSSQFVQSNNPQLTGYSDTGFYSKKA